MKDQSLMNPTFAQEELAHHENFLESVEEFTADMHRRCEAAYDVFRRQDLVTTNRETYVVTKEEMRNIVNTLSEFDGHTWGYSSPRRVIITQLSQLLDDRRYKIATTIMNLFRRK